jgi:hypothetical protein
LRPGGKVAPESEMAYLDVSFSRRDSHMSSPTKSDTGSQKCLSIFIATSRLVLHMQVVFYKPCHSIHEQPTRLPNPQENQGVTLLMLTKRLTPTYDLVSL